MIASGDRPKAVDLFAGAGGMSLGLEQAGFDVVGAVEYDPVHAATHEFNFPGASTICASVTDLTADELCRRVAKMKLAPNVCRFPGTHCSPRRSAS